MDDPTSTDDLTREAGIPNRTRYLLFGEMLVFATLSLIASFVLSYDAIKIAADPNVVLSCNISPLLNCVKVGSTWQAHVLGFPNAFLGMISEPVVMTIAVASLSKVRFPRWFMFTANIVYLLGVIFAYWLLFQSTFAIGALCPWCLLVTISTTFVFWSMTQWNVHEGNLFLPDHWQARALDWLHGGLFTVALVVWFGIVLIVELIHWLPAFL